VSENRLLDIRGLEVVFRGSRRARPVHAVKGVDLWVEPGRTLGLVGESGSGKSTIGNAVLGLVPVTSGAIMFQGEDIARAAPRRRRELGEQVQVVFQDPYSSLNPSRTVGHTLSEPLRVRGRLGRREADQRVAQVLTDVGLSPGAARRYPGHFSGGQRQRIAIARALVRSPKLIICDEPTSALDLSVQAQILNLLLELQRSSNVAYLFISHDIDVVRHMSHRITVLRNGEVVEEGGAAEVIESPGHDYTKALIAAVPVPDPRQQAKRREARLARAAASP
jgi:ABC-type glutathione transport system ATPase component